MDAQGPGGEMISGMKTEQFLMSTFRAWRIVDPVQDDQRQTADHEEDPHHQENQCRYFLRRLHW